MGCDVELALADVIAVVQQELYLDEQRALLKNNGTGFKVDLCKKQTVDSDDSFDKGWSLSSSGTSTCFSISDFSTDGPSCREVDQGGWKSCGDTSLILPSLVESSFEDVPAEAKELREVKVNVFGGSPGSERDGVGDWFAVGGHSSHLGHAPRREPASAVIDTSDADAQFDLVGPRSTAPHLVVNGKGRFVWRTDSCKGKRSGSSD